eukprot:gene3994-4995_t
MLRKGVDWIKIDVHYMTSVFCTSQGLNDSRGCFVLSHDLPVSYVRYNNTDQLIDYIVEKKDTWFGEGSSRKHLALCFKVDGFEPCDKVPEAGDFVQLTGELVTEFQKVLGQYQMNLEIIIDGEAIPVDCLANKWRPFNATWMGDPMMALMSDNKTLGYDLFQIADLPIPIGTPTHYVDQLCQVDPPYGKFRNNSYPLLVWEPSDQSDILSVCNSYVGCMTSNQELQFPDIRFAINIDPVQFSVYSAAVSKKAWNLKFNSTGIDDSYAWTRFSIGMTKVVTVTTSDNVNMFFLLFTNSTDSQQVYYHQFYSKQILGQVQSLGTFSLPYPNNILQQVTTTKLFTTPDTDQTFLLVSDELSNYLVYKIDVTQSPGSDLSLLTYGTLRQSTQEKQKLLSTLDFVSYDPDTLSITIIQYEYGTTDNCKLNSTLWKIGLNSTHPNSNNILGENRKCLYSPEDSPSSKSSEIDSVASVNSHNPWSPCLYDVIVEFSTDYKIYGLFVCISDSNQVSVQSGPSFFNVGKNVALSSVNINGSIFVMEVHDEGYCYNTEDNNKRAQPRVCEASPVSYSGILNYNYGMFSDFLIHIQNQLELSVCDSTILHGTYDQGYSPDVFLFPGSYSSGSSDIGVVATHKGISETYFDFSLCGRAESWDDIVLDSWNLNNFILQQ